MMRILASHSSSVARSHILCISKVIFQDTLLPGVKCIRPTVFGDTRGYFFEQWNQQRYLEGGLPINFVQDNVSSSQHGILRGLHFQHPHAQGKLVQVLRGEVFDVAVDIRLGSPTFGQWYGMLLSEENHCQLWIPEGFAHGFCVTSDSALFSYKCTAFYHPATEFTLRWDDPDIHITWPVTHPILSPKDQSGFFLKNFPKESLPLWHP